MCAWCGVCVQTLHASTQSVADACEKHAQSTELAHACEEKHKKKHGTYSVGDDDELGRSVVAINVE
jgi:hypothetical protein